MRDRRSSTLAVTFLTGIPLKVEGEVSPGDLWRSMGWYPLVGLALGAAAWAVYAGLIELLPGLVAATLVVHRCWRPSPAGCTWTASWTPPTAC